MSKIKAVPIKKSQPSKSSKKKTVMHSDSDSFELEDEAAHVEKPATRVARQVTQKVVKYVEIDDGDSMSEGSEFEA